MASSNTVRPSWSRRCESGGRNRRRRSPLTNSVTTAVTSPRASIAISDTVARNVGSSDASRSASIARIRRWEGDRAAAPPAPIRTGRSNPCSTGSSGRTSPSRSTGSSTGLTTNPTGTRSSIVTTRVAGSSVVTWARLISGCCARRCSIGVKSSNTLRNGEIAAAANT